MILFDHMFFFVVVVVCFVCFVFCFHLNTDGGICQRKLKEVYVLERAYLIIGN